MGAPEVVSEDDESDDPVPEEEQSRDVEPPDDDDGGDIMGGFDGVEEDREAEENMSVGEADLGLSDDDGIVASFDGVDDEDGGSSSDTGSGSRSTGSSGASTSGISIESAIEEGLAELAAVGLEGRERQEVTTEMERVADKFKVGYFGKEVVQKYLKRDLEDIPPELGLLGALIGFAAFAIKVRPDGKERLNELVSIVKGEAENPPQPGAPPQPEQPQQPPEEMTQRDVPQPETPDEPGEQSGEPTESDAAEEAEA